MCPGIELLDMRQKVFQLPMLYIGGLETMTSEAQIEPVVKIGMEILHFVEQRLFSKVQ
ncbi:hypothetical protein D3C85_1614410 [compost metagenome]